jgi:hypothetical protein
VRRVRSLLALIEASIVIVALGGFGFLLLMLVMGNDPPSDFEDPGPFVIWVGELATAAFNNPALWFGGGIAVLLSVLVALIALAARLDPENRVRRARFSNEKSAGCRPME